MYKQMTLLNTMDRILYESQRQVRQAKRYIIRGRCCVLVVSLLNDSALKDVY